MKYYLLLIICFLNFNTTNAQSKEELKSVISSLKMEIEKLNSRIAELENQISILQKNESSQTEVLNIDTCAVKQNQCKAITQAGKRCSRTAQYGSEYCWQHQTRKNEQKSSELQAGSRKIYTGPRGGKYYINASGKKVYIKQK